MKKDKVYITPKGEDGHKVFSVRLKCEIVKQLDYIATSTGRSRNDVIGLLLECAIERFEPH